MFRLFRISQVFFAPELPEGSTPSLGGTSKEDMIDFLNADDEEELEIEDSKSSDKSTEEKTKESPKIKDDSDNDENETDEEDETDEEGDDLEDLEQELEGPTDEQLELVTPVRRKEILAKYPSLFKEFPYLEKAYYREQQFTELLPTIEDAKQAVAKAETLDKYEQELMDGNIETALKAMKSESPKAFNKLVDNYLQTLGTIDEKAYHHVLGNITKHTIMAMVQEAKRSNSDALQSAAQILNQFIFGTSDFIPPSQLASHTREDDGREKEIQNKEREFTQRRFTVTRDELNTKVNNTLRNTIDAHIDPKQSMTDYVKRNASRDALDALETSISKDARFKAIIDKLWEKAFENDFSQDTVNKIRTAYLSKAKTLLPSVIKKARSEALRGMGRKTKDENDESVTPTNRSPVSVGRPRSQSINSGKITKAADIPKGMRTIDFLMQD
jgi:hypothetical protein